MRAAGTAWQPLLAWDCLSSCKKALNSGMQLAVGHVFMNGGSPCSTAAAAMQPQARRHTLGAHRAGWKAGVAVQSLALCCHNQHSQLLLWLEHGVCQPLHKRTTFGGGSRVNRSKHDDLGRHDVKELWCEGQTQCREEGGDGGAGTHGHPPPASNLSSPACVTNVDKWMTDSLPLEPVGS